MKRNSDQLEGAKPAKRVAVRHSKIDLEILHQFNAQNEEAIFKPEEGDKIRAFLDKNGFVVVQALSTERAKEFENMAWDWIESMGKGVSRNEPSTWDQETMWPNQKDGVFRSYGVGQSEVMWRARTEPGVLKSFEQIWNTTNLMVSYDGFGCMPAVKQTNPFDKFIGSPFAKKEFALWPHRDQRLSFKDRTSVQGLVSLIDTTNSNDGGFVVWPGTHLHDFSARYHTEIDSKIDWLKLDGDDPMGSPDKARVIRCPAGCAIFWDSRVIHCNRPPTPISQHTRIALYVSMLPRSSIPAKDLKRVQKKRKEYFANHSTSTHSPNHGTKNPDSVMWNTKNVNDPKPVVERLKQNGPPNYPDIQNEIMKLI